MHIKRQGQVLTKKIACLDSAFKGLDSLALVSAIKGQRLDGAIFFISTALPFYNVLLPHRDTSVCQVLKWVNNVK